MSTVESNGNTFGWGADARGLSCDEAYGAKVLNDTEAAELCLEITKAGWRPFTKRVLEERQVFLISPGKWRRPISLKSNPGQILQVVEVPAMPALSDEG